MRTILVTGSEGFVGRNVCAALSLVKDVRLHTFDTGDSPERLLELAGQADAIIHLAGVNRPERPEEFTTGNATLTETILSHLQAQGKHPTFILSSSTQALLDNPYGLSKRQAEQAVLDYHRHTAAPVCIYRFPNLFGKWSRPNYNSAVATFCHNTARDLPVTVHDPLAPLRLVYIDDLLEEFLRALDGAPTRDGNFCTVTPVHDTTVGAVLEQVRSFKANRGNLGLPDLADPLSRKLYSTYLSFLPADGFSYPLTMHADARGSFTEFLRTPDRGQVSVNIARPGITKGNHWHHTKNEKFLVVSGQGLIRFRKIGTTEILEYPVSGTKLEVVDIPPGYTHNISNLGDTDMVTVMWVNEAFDPTRPDTFMETV